MRVLAALPPVGVVADRRRAPSLGAVLLPPERSSDLFASPRKLRQVELTVMTCSDLAGWSGQPWRNFQVSPSSASLLHAVSSFGNVLSLPHTDFITNIGDSPFSPLSFPYIFSVVPTGVRHISLVVKLCGWF